MRLYIANPTRQTQVVCYRLDYNKRGEPEELRRFQPARQQDIPPGRQIPLGGDFHKSQIEDIVDQLSAYGLKGVVDVQNGRLGQRVVPYVYNIDQYVKYLNVEYVEYIFNDNYQYHHHQHDHHYG